MKDRKIVLLMALGGLAVISLIYGLMTPSKHQAGSSAGGPTSAVGSASSGTFESSSFAERQSPRSSYQIWGRNPFSAKPVSAETVSALTLNGIVWDEKNPRAVINDRIVGVGNKVEGHKVVKIEKYRVVLTDGLVDFELRLGRKR